MGIWRVSGSTRLHNLAARSILVLSSTPSGTKLVGVLNRMGMKLASKFNGTLMAKFKLFEVIKSVFTITGPANTQKDNMKSHRFCTNEFAYFCMLPLCRLQLSSRPCVLTAPFCFSYAALVGRHFMLQLSFPCRQSDSAYDSAVDTSELSLRLCFRFQLTFTQPLPLQLLFHMWSDCTLFVRLGFNFLMLVERVSPATD
eukprot:1160455-Pelagomonas_calceolata.AAC.4